jgi:hypothetical protein
MTIWKAALLFCGVAVAGWAQTNSADVRSCELWSLKGPYLLTIGGTRPAPIIANGITATPGTIEQVTGLFVIVFDGRGGFTVPAPIIVKGSLSGLFPDQPGTGTYTLDGDCTGRFSVNLPQLPGPLVNSMVVLNRGKEFRSVVVSPQPVMITVSAVKIE